MGAIDREWPGMPGRWIVAEIRQWTSGTDTLRTNALVPDAWRRGLVENGLLTEKMVFRPSAAPGR